jgi:hypothetical protein
MRKTGKKKNIKRRKTLKRGGFWPFSSAPVANPGLVTNPNTSQSPNSLIFVPKPGQFGYKDPNRVNLTGSHTSYSVSDGTGLFGVRGFTNPGANPFAPGAMQHTQMTGIPQAIGLISDLSTAKPSVKGSFNASAMPPDYYTTLGIVNKRIPLTKAELNSAYNRKKNLGSNTDKKLLKDAYNTLSDPVKRYKYDESLSNYMTNHPPSIANIYKMQEQAGVPYAANALKGTRQFLPIGITSAINNPINPTNIQWAR